MARKKRCEEGEVPIMRGWHKLPVKEFSQDDEMIALAAQRVDLKKDLYGDLLPSPAGVYYDEPENSLIIYFHAPGRGLSRPQEASLLVYTVESRDNPDVLYHFDKSLAAVEVQNLIEPLTDSVS